MLVHITVDYTTLNDRPAILAETKHIRELWIQMSGLEMYRTTHFSPAVVWMSVGGNVPEVTWSVVTLSVVRWLVVRWLVVLDVPWLVVKIRAVVWLTVMLVPVAVFVVLVTFVLATVVRVTVVGVTVVGVVAVGETLVVPLYVVPSVELTLPVGVAVSKDTFVSVKNQTLSESKKSEI